MNEVILLLSAKVSVVKGYLNFNFKPLSFDLNKK